MVRARCFALARIRTSAALAALAAERKAASDATTCDTATVTLIDYLASPAFEKTDPAIALRAAAKAAGPASATDPVAPPPKTNK